MLVEGLWGTGGTNTLRDLLLPLTWGGWFEEVTGGEKQRQKVIPSLIRQHLHNCHSLFLQNMLLN